MSTRNSVSKTEHFYLDRLKSAIKRTMCVFNIFAIVILYYVDKNQSLGRMMNSQKSKHAYYTADEVLAEIVVV